MKKRRGSGYILMCRVLARSGGAWFGVTFDFVFLWEITTARIPYESLVVEPKSFLFSDKYYKILDTCPFKPRTLYSSVHNALKNTSCSSNTTESNLVQVVIQFNTKILINDDYFLRKRSILKNKNLRDVEIVICSKLNILVLCIGIRAFLWLSEIYQFH